MTNLTLTELLAAKNAAFDAAKTASDNCKAANKANKAPAAEVKQAGHTAFQAKQAADKAYDNAKKTTAAEVKQAGQESYEAKQAADEAYNNVASYASSTAYAVYAAKLASHQAKLDAEAAEAAYNNELKKA